MEGLRKGGDRGSGSADLFVLYMPSSVRGVKGTQHLESAGSAVAKPCGAKLSRRGHRGQVHGQLPEAQLSLSPTTP